MELDELKQTWKDTPIHKPTNTDIMDLIQQKTYGPLAALKNVYRKQMIMMAIIPFVLLLTNMQDISRVYTSIMFWSYVLFCIGVISFAYRNYQITREMEIMDRVVKTNLELHITLLEKRMKWELFGLRCGLGFFVLLTEIVPYFQHYRMLDKWHSCSPFIRFGAYAGLLLLQYVMNRGLSKRKVGRHIAYLRTLADELKG